MKYDDVKLDVLWFPHDRHLTLIQYTSRTRTPETKLIWDFKENQLPALRKVCNLAFQVLRDYEGLEMFRSGYLVAIPGHAAGGINAPCEYLCAALARAFPHQLVHLKQALERVVEVKKSSKVPPRARPTYADHIRSIRYAGPQINPHERIIMVDDVLTRGETSRACRDILMKATGCTDVLGLFVGKTLYQ